VIINNYPIYIYKRPGFDILKDFGAKLTVLDAPLLEISSTRIRELIKQRKSIRFLVPDVVQQEIEMNGYYRS
jgi:nicotinate-nucleotide adenylyltransferase